MGGGVGFSQPPWTEVCAAVSATLDDLTLSGRFTNPTDPASVAATLGRSLAGVSKEILAEAERLRAVLSDSGSDQGFAAFRAVYPALAEAVARVAEADVVLSRLADGAATVASWWPGIRDELVKHLEDAALHLTLGHGGAAIEDMVRADAIAARAAGGDCEWNPAYKSFTDARYGRNQEGGKLAKAMTRISEHAARAADLLLPLTQQHEGSSTTPAAIAPAAKPLAASSSSRSRMLDRAIGACIG
ncbi:hypothetical protein ACP70R_030303 [Stipagrostis hirtigluma subsp. patula]